MDPDNEKEAKPSRPTINTIEANAAGVHPTKEQKIVNEILFDSFGYVQNNGYLGTNKIINYELQNNALRYRADLGLPRSFEPNHGPVALLPQLSTQQDPKQIKSWLTKQHRRKLIWKAAMADSVQSKSALPDDINMNAPSHCLRHWEKPNFMNYSINTRFKLEPAFEGDGRQVEKYGMRSTYDTWRSPLITAPPIKIPGLPVVQVQERIRQHDHVHY
jgi:hypothetical protein